MASARHGTRGARPSIRNRTMVVGLALGFMGFYMYFMATSVIPSIGAGKAASEVRGASDPSPRSHLY